MLLELVGIIVVFLLEKVFVFIKEQVILLVVFLDKLSFIVFIDFYSLVFEVPDDFLCPADIET